jgi:hypothetical protein
MMPVARWLVAVLCTTACHASVVPAPNPGARPGAAPAEEARPEEAPPAPAPTAEAPSERASAGEGAELVHAFTDRDPQNGCKPGTHPLAGVLTRDLGTSYVALACDALLLDDEVGGLPSYQRIPGFVVRRTTTPERQSEAARAKLDRHEDAARFVQRYWRELGLQSEPREALVASGDGKFVQRVPSTRIDAEGFVEVWIHGEQVMEARFSLMPGLSAYVTQRASWNDARAKVLEHAASSGLLAPRVVSMPRGVVTRADGLVWSVDVVGMEMNVGGVSPTAPRRFRVSASTNAIVSETTLRRRGDLVR